MMRSHRFICTGCNASYPADRLEPRCDSCGEPIECGPVKNGRIREGKTLRQTVFERYGDFFPLLPQNGAFTLGEGFTPLVTSPRIASIVKIKSLYFKNESTNPTWSFKDRGTAAGVRHALSLGLRKIGTVSSGNMAASVAAYGARAGLTTFIMVSASIPREKINPIAIYNPTVIMVEGNYGDMYFKSLEIGRKKEIYFINSDVPLRVEGSKTIAFEICEQLSFNVPDFVIVPTSSGGNLRGIMKGFDEFLWCGLIDRLPTFIAVQASGCAPIERAFTSGAERVDRVDNPDTIAHAIENPYPPSGNEILRQVRRRNGIVASVDDSEILTVQQEMAGEGFFAQPAAAAPLAALVRLRKQKRLSENDSVVCVITGAGLKYTAVFDRYSLATEQVSLDNLEAFFGIERAQDRRRFP